MRILIDEKMEELGVEEVFSLLMEPQPAVKFSFLRELSEVGSTEELNLMLTDFHFSQQVIFDFYDIDVTWEF